MNVKYMGGTKTIVKSAATTTRAGEEKNIGRRYRMLVAQTSFHNANLSIGTLLVQILRYILGAFVKPRKTNC